MTIVFQCPFCQEPYRLKDELAGKRCTCRKATCRKIFTVPASSNGAAVKAPVDAESAAAEIFSDEPVKQEAAPQQKIKVTCAQCEHTWEVDAALEGKNVPCPECRKIVKVPLRKQNKPVDWRDSKGGLPSLAKQDPDPKMDNVWGGERDIVRRDTLEAAGAIPKADDREPLPTIVKVKRILLAAGLLLAMAAGAMYFLKSRKEHKVEASIADAVNEVEASEEAKGQPLLNAGIYRAAGEHRLRSIETKQDLEEAEKTLTRAAAKLRESPATSAERNGLLIEVAAQMAALGGTTEQVTDEKRREWRAVQKHIRQTLQDLPTDRDLKSTALRAVTRQLAAQKQGELAIPIAQEVAPEDLAEALGQIGLQLVRVGQKDVAQKVLEKAPSLLGDSPDRAASAPALTALRVVLGPGEQLAPAGNLPGAPPPANPLNEVSRVAYAEGLALQGRFDQARSLAERAGSQEGRVRAWAAIAAAALQAGNADVAGAAADAACKIIVAEMKGNAPPWLTIRVARLAGRAGKADAAKAAVEQIADDSAKAWAWLEILRGRLDALPKQAGQDAWLDELGDPGKPRVASAMGRLELARHNTAAGDGGYSKTVDGWPAGVFKPFGKAGIALGVQDR